MLSVLLHLSSPALLSDLLAVFSEHRRQSDFSKELGGGGVMCSS